MNTKDNPYTEIDPYQILGVPYTATGKQIQQAFQSRIKQADQSELLIKAYGMIRDQSGRDRFLWEDIRGCHIDPRDKKTESGISEDLVRELAFLCSWELGDDA